MLESITPKKPIEPERGPLLRFLSQPGVLAGSAAINIVVMIIAAAIWIGAHTTYWKGQFTCFASFSVGAIERWGLMAATVVAAASSTFLLFRISKTTRHPSPRTVTRYWLATGALWLAAAVSISAAAVTVGLCMQGNEL